MNNEKNEINNLLNQQKNDNHSKENGSINNIKYKFKKLKSSCISNNKIYEIYFPRRKNLKKISHTKNLLRQSLKTKHSNANKKEKDRRDIKKKNTINSINQNYQNELSKQNSLGGSISPKRIRKINIEDNDDKDNNIINLFEMTDKLYTNDEHFQKDLIQKNKVINKNSSSNTIKRNQLMSGRINNLQQKKKLIITFGLNEDNNNLKNSFADNSEKNFHFKRRISVVTKGIDSEFNKNKEKSNFSYYLKLKQKLRTPSKEINDESKGNTNNNNNHKNENHKVNALHSCHTNKEKSRAKRNSQFYREKTNKTFKNIESPKKAKEEENEKEETYSKPKKSNNIKKVNSKKSNNIKNYNKTQIPNDVVEIPKTENQKKHTNLKSKFCFLCCLTNKLNDSDEF